MASAWVLPAGLLLAFAAWIALSLGLPRYQPPVLGRTLPPAICRRLRALGWALLAADLALLIATRGWQLGPIFWTCALIVSVIVWALLLTRLSRR